MSLELNSGGSPKLVIDNRSSPGWGIASLDVDFSSANVILDTTAADSWAFDAVDRPLSFLTPGVFGAYSTAVTSGGLAAYDGAANLAALAGDINGSGLPGRVMSFSFVSGLLPGEGWGIEVDWDRLTSNDSPRGADINGTAVTATFFEIDRPNRTQELTFVYSGLGGNGVSFPGTASATAVPEPALFGLCGVAALVVMGARRQVAVRRRRPAEC